MVQQLIGVFCIGVIVGIVLSSCILEWAILKTKKKLGVK